MSTDGAVIPTDADAKSGDAEICYIVEGAYPYVVGGVSSWLHALIKSAPSRPVAVVAIRVGDDEAEHVYELPENVVEFSSISLASSQPGRSARQRDYEAIMLFHELASLVLRQGNEAAFAEAKNLILTHELSQWSLLNSRQAWPAIMAQYSALMPSTSMLQFFWTWRTLVSGLLVAMFADYPEAKMYHAISTGYAGLIGARIAMETNRPYLVTEHGIYTNERRIELCVADWIYDSRRAGMSVTSNSPELRDLWLSAFSSFARLAYQNADQITTLYEGNQIFQMADGAPPGKLSVIPNGVDAEQLCSIQRKVENNHRPTVALIGRVVPIKDIRMFITACAILQKEVRDVRVLILGPDAEDPEYAEECRQLVQKLGLDDTIEFCGHVNIDDYLPTIDLLALTSLSEAQPLVLLEAGAAGIPSVVTDVGSCRQIIEGFEDDPVTGKGGMVVPCGDANAAGATMAEILCNDGLRRKMGAVMQERVKTTYNKSIIDRRYSDLYDIWINIGEQRAELELD